MGARAAILDCEASICNRELAAAPTPPRPPSRWQIIAQVEACAPPSVSGWQAGLERHAGARMGARAAILDCEASICNRELAAAPTPPRLPSRWQIIAQVEECAPPSVSGRQAGLEWHAGARMALLGFRGGCGRRKLARGAWDYTGGWVSAGFRVSRNSVGASVIIHIHTRSEK